MDFSELMRLAGGHVELMLDTDPTVRSDGLIEPDGSFTLQTLHQGQVLRGAPAGSYKARIILPEPEDGGGRKGRPAPVHSRYLDFKTSGLSVTVPTSGSVTLTVSRK